MYILGYVNLITRLYHSILDTRTTTANMISLIAASVLLCGVNAILLPLSQFNGPEPELLFVCPAPSAPAYGLITCDYDLFQLSCTATCSAGYSFSNGADKFMVECSLFDGGFTSGDMPKCVRDGGVVVPTSGPLGPVNPSGSATCVRNFNDCLNRMPGDYAYCDDCRKFVTCAGSGFYVRPCPALTVFDPVFDSCRELSLTAANTCKLV